MPFAALDLSTSEYISSRPALENEPTQFYSTVPSLSPPINRSLETNAAAVLTWLFNNPTSGAVTYDLVMTNDAVNPWFDDSLMTTPVTVGATSSASFDISVTIPTGTPRGTAATATVTATDQAGVAAVLTGSVTVMARDIYSGIITDNNTVHNVLPGANGTVRYTVTNDGTAATAYSISSEIIQAPEGWIVSMEGTLEQPFTTAVILPGASLMVTVTVRPASLTNPLDPMSMLTQGLQLSLRTTAIPIGGGSPSIENTIMEVGGAISAAVTPDVDYFELTQSELLAHSISKFVGVTISLQHNLPALPQGAVANISLSVDSPLIDPATAGTGTSEALRWNGTVSPPYHESLSMSENVRATAGILGPVDDYPISGDLEFIIRAQITELTGIGVAVDYPPGLANFTVHIPEIVDARLFPGANGTGQPGLASSMSVTLMNIGNDHHNFTVGASGPEGWEVSVSQPNVTEVESRPADWPAIDGSENRTVTIVVTPPADALAETAHPILVDVKSSLTGQQLHDVTAYFEVGEVFGAAIEPEEVTTTMEKGQVGSLVLGLNNSGNSNQTFDLALSGASPELDVTLLDGSSISVGPRLVGAVRVQVIVSVNARADQIHSFQVILSQQGTELGRSTVTIAVGAEHNLIFAHNASFEGTPGTALSMPFSVQNDGNQRETMRFEILSKNNWTAEYTPSPLSIEPKAPAGSVTASISIPPLDASNFLAAGEVHNITLNAIDSTTGDVIGSSIFEIEIQAFFILQTIERPERISVLPGETRTVEYIVANEGNQDVTVQITCSVDSNRFTFTQSSCPTVPVALPIGQSVSISPSFGANAPDHFDGESGWFTMTFTPTGGIGGTSQEQTRIEVVRILADDEIRVRSTNGRTQTFDLPWMHVPGQGQTSDTGQKYYQLSPNGQTRIIDPAQYSNLSAWELELILTNGSSQPVSQSMMLGPVSPYDSSVIGIRVTLPPLGMIPAGDGWNLSFILTNIAESTLTHFMIKLRVDEYADPIIASVEWSNTTLLESQAGSLVATIVNDGTALFPLSALAMLSCSNSDLIVHSEPAQIIPELGPGGSVEIIWNITAPALGWWSPTEPVGCDVSLILPTEIAGNNVSNDIYSSSLVVTSWAPPGGLWTAGPLTLILLIGTVVLNRRGREDEKLMHLSAYTAAAAFAALTYVATDPLVSVYLQSDPAMVGILAYVGATVTILWTLNIAWKSSSELQAIHDDRRKAMTGGRPELSGHDQELANTRRQLKTILSMPPLLFVLLMIATPDLRISLSPLNLLTILAYCTIAPLVISMLLGHLDKSFGRVNTMLGELEIRTIRIKEIVNASDSPRTRMFADDDMPAPPEIPQMEDLGLDDEYDDVMDSDSEMGGYDESMDEGMEEGMGVEEEVDE